MFDVAAQWWANLVLWTSVHAVVPMLSFLHVDRLMGDPNDIAAAVLIALIQLAIISCVFRPLETFAPAEIRADRKLTNIDRTFTLLMVLVLNPVFAFLVLTPFANLFGGGADAGATAEPSGGLLGLVPDMQRHPYLAFFLYYIVYDLTYYWMHRAQHAIPWWWALHSMHHSQRQMSCWTNDRGSYLDGVLQSFVLASAGLLMGVDAEQFALLELVSELVQNFSHTNTRIGFGRFFERVFVAPIFHRLHHMRVDPSRPNLHNCNFGQVLSVWDNLFGTALYGEPVRPTGVGDPTVDADNGRGVIAMQWGALKRFWGALRCVDGWKLQEVAFDEKTFRPIPVSHVDLHAFEPAVAGHAPSRIELRT
ncbi:MAG: sterol desaturase family protein [Rudaea sp.]|uniref:sterol desaturase family protein n=1 Tax=Rudaea sp. TaxID=2136325 RepID=UPI0039E22BE7